MTGITDIASERTRRAASNRRTSAGNRALCRAAILAMDDDRLEKLLPILEMVIDAQQPKSLADVVPLTPR